MARQCDEGCGIPLVDIDAGSLDRAADAITRNCRCDLATMVREDAEALAWNCLHKQVCDEIAVY